MLDPPPASCCQKGIGPFFWLKWLELRSIIPTGRIHEHSSVLGAELGIQYTYAYVKDSEHHRIRIRYTYPALSQEFLS